MEIKAEAKRIGSMLFLLSIVTSTCETKQRDGKWNINFRPHHNDHRHWGPFFEETPANASGLPGFSSGGFYALAVPAGGHLHLDCRVAMLQDKTVMWVKKTEERVSLLTVGPTLYSADARVSLKFQYPNNYRLEISPVQQEDEGLYMCQLSTHPPRVRATNLTVLSPDVMLVDEYGVSVSERHYKEGSRIELQCRGRIRYQQHRQSQNTTEKKLKWQKDGETTQLSLKTSTISIDGAEMAISRLLVPSASPSDSGAYSCQLPGQGQAAVNVHVLQGETQAAVHHEKSAAPDTASLLSPTYLTLLLVYAFHYKSILQCKWNVN